MVFITLHIKVRRMQLNEVIGQKYLKICLDLQRNPLIKNSQVWQHKDLVDYTARPQTTEGFLFVFKKKRRWWTQMTSRVGETLTMLL